MDLDLNLAAFCFFGAFQFCNFCLNQIWIVFDNIVLSTVGVETVYEAVTAMWEYHCAALLNSPKNCEIGNLVKQNINSHGNFGRIDDLLRICNSYKIKSLLHKIPLDHVAGNDGIFAEHIFYADSSVCDYLSSLFNVCLMHGNIPQECMQTVVLGYLFVKTRMRT